MKNGCCEVAASRLNLCRSQVSRLARKAARLAQKGRPIDALMAEIAHEKALLAQAEAYVVDHACNREAS